jgi:hypothetical protein
MVPLPTTPAATPSPMPTQTTLLPNTPQAASLAPGSGSDLTVTWTPPAVDSSHSAATAFDLQSSPSGANTWTTVSNVTSPYDLSGLAAGAAIDVQIQSANSAGTSAWSATSTLTTASASSALNTPSITSVAAPPDGTNTKLTVTWTAAGNRQHPRCRHRLQPALWPLRNRRLDDGVRCYQSLRYHRSDGCERDRRRSASHGRHGNRERVVRYRHRHDVGRHPLAWKLDCCARASPRNTRSTEHGCEHDRDRCTDRGERSSLRLVRELVRTSHQQLDRGQCRWPDQRMGPVVQRTCDLWYLLSLVAGGRRQRRYDRGPRYIGDHGVLAAKPRGAPDTARVPARSISPAIHRAAACPSRQRPRRTVSRPLPASALAPRVRAPQQ